MNNGQKNAPYGFLGLNGVGVITNPAFLGTGINTTQIGNGDVTNTQLSYLNTLTSNVQTQINNIIIGLVSFEAVAIATANITIAAPGSTNWDGITPNVGDSVFLLPTASGGNQTNAAQGGLYTYNGASSPLTRYTGMSTWPEVVGSRIYIKNGGTTFGGTAWINTNNPGGTIGTTAITYTQQQNNYVAGTNLSLTGNVFSTIASPSFTSAIFSANTNFLTFGTTNTTTFTMASLTGNRIFTTPDANSNSVQPSAGSTNQFVNAISNAGVLSYGFPGIINDVQATVTNASITTSTDIIVAIAPLMNANGYCLLTITDGGNALTIQYRLKLNQYNIGQQPPYLIDNVWDTKGILTKDNLSNYLTFIAYYKSSNPTYIAVTVRMTGGLLYSSSTLKYICTCFGEFFLSDNTGFTQYLGKNVTNLPAATSTYKLNGNTVQYSSFPASSLFLYAAGTGNGQAYTINSSTGVLTNQSNFPSSGAFDVVATPNGQVVFINNTSGGAQIFGYNVNIATGGLTLGTTNASGATSLQYMAIHPNGNFLYLTALAGIYMYSISGTTLTALSPASVSGSNCLEVTIHPNGQYLYVAGGGNSVIYQFSINTTTGQLTPLSPASIGSVDCSQVAVHPSGNFAYSTINISGAGSGVNMFSIDSTGHLAALSPATATSGNLPQGIAVTPNGLYAYAVNNGDNTISCYSINTTTGQLTNFATVSTGSSPTWVKIAPSGEYLYVPNRNTHTVQGYTISSTGVLNSIGTISVAAAPNQIVIV